MIKSQDDLNQDDGVGRTMTLLKAIEQLEKTELELEKVKKQLKIAIKAINKGLTSNYILQADVREDMDLYTPLYDKSPEKKEFERQERALSKALEQIKELDK